MVNFTDMDSKESVGVEEVMEELAKPRVELGRKRREGGGRDSIFLGGARGLAHPMDPQAPACWRREAAGGAGGGGGLGGADYTSPLPLLSFPAIPVTRSSTPGAS